MYTTLFDAETALSDANWGVSASKLEAIKIINDIRTNKLFKEMTDQAGKPLSSLDQYLKLKNDDLKRFAGMGGRHILRHLKAYLLYCDQMGYTDQWFLDMGEHALVLSEAANMGRDLTLRAEDAPSPYTGLVLGQSSFREQVEDVYSQIEDEEVRWQVKDTRQLVNNILGKSSPSSPAWDAECIWEGDKIKINNLTWTLDGRVVSLESNELWDAQDFMVFATREHIRVSGLGESYANTHYR